MSWNISLRLNNIEQQIKNIQNDGLLNPLQENIQGNGYDIIGIKDIDATGEINTSGNIFCNLIETTTETGTAISTSKIDCNNIDCQGDISCFTLNYTELNPPISGGAQNLAQTLTQGNSGIGQGMTNMGTIQITNGSLEIESGGAGDTRNLIQMINLDDTLLITHGDINGINNAKFTIGNAETNYITFLNNPSNYTTISCSQLLRNTSSSNPANQTGYILDSLNTPPSYKQIFSNVNQTITDKNLSSGVPYWLFGLSVYNGDTIFNYGINYVELLLPYFQINFTSDTPFTPLSTCQLYITSTLNGNYDPTKGNRITFNLTNNSSGQANFTFTSTIPILLYYQNGNLGDTLTNLYFNVIVSQSITYTISLINTNMIITSSIVGKNNDTLTFNT